MTINDLVKFVVTPQMFEKAKDEALSRKVKWGYSTRPVIKERDIIGSLAHQGVENILKIWGVSYESYREVEYKGGDFADLRYEEDYLDVKGTRKDLNERYFYNENFLVFSDQLKKEVELINRFVFVGLERDFSKGYIYGVIDPQIFVKLATDVKLQYDNKCIKAHQLTPFRNYIFKI